jgi:hypothetical protein
MCTEVRCAKLRCEMRRPKTDLLVWRSESLEVHAAHDFLFPPKIMSVTSTSTDQLLPQTTNA